MLSTAVTVIQYGGMLFCSQERFVEILREPIHSSDAKSSVVHMGQDARQILTQLLRHMNVVMSWTDDGLISMHIIRCYCCVSKSFFL